MPTTSFSAKVANVTGQSMGYVQSDGFYSPVTLGTPEGTATPHSQGPAQFPFGILEPTFGNIVTSTTGIVAHAGGGQASAVLFTTQYNVIATVGTAADSVKLPAGTSMIIGQAISVRNSGANAAAVFPNTGGTINGGGANASVSLAAGATAVYQYTAANTWNQIF